MSYHEAIGYLYGLQKHGVKLGLDTIGSLLHSLGNPHRHFRAIHVAGTNGKGSVSAMAASILTAHGFKVGLFTSPHLVSFTERIQIDREQISEDEVLSLTEEICSLIAQRDSSLPLPTFFEVVTAMAFLYFQRQRIDWAVVEVGMGGRLDATNVIAPEVSVVTRISYDHQQFLGKTLADIAGEKAGIIKEGIPVISASQETEAMHVLTSISGTRLSPLFLFGRDFQGNLKCSDIEGTSFDYTDESQVIPAVSLPLIGEHQVENGCLAIKAAVVALQRSGAGMPDRDSVKRGLGTVKWPGRLQIVSRDPFIMVDGAHNPHAAHILSGFLARHLSDYKIIMVIGIMADKDYENILESLLPLAAHTVFTAPNYERAASPKALASYAVSRGFSNIQVEPAIDSALSEARGLYASLINRYPCLILITGSFYTAGEAMDILGERAILGTLRETR